MKKSIFGSLMLLLTAIIWGFAFVAQSVGIDAVGPFLFNGTRNILGSIVLIPVILILKKKGIIEKIFTKDAVIGGVCCGLCLFFASTFQQWGIQQSTVGKASFITALYVVFVPILGLVIGYKATWKVWVSVGIAIVGLYLLCMAGSLSFSTGDIYLMICAVLFAIHILVIDHFSPKANGVVISCIQFMVTGILCYLLMPVFGECFDWSLIMEGKTAILYAGVLSCGVAYTLQIVFQKDVDPTAASLILCMESVFGAIGGWLFLGQTLSIRELCGCALMFAAIVLSQF